VNGDAVLTSSRLLVNLCSPSDADRQRILKRKTPLGKFPFPHHHQKTCLHHQSNRTSSITLLLPPRRQIRRPLLLFSSVTFRYLIFSVGMANSRCLVCKKTMVASASEDHASCQRWLRLAAHPDTLSFFGIEPSSQQIHHSSSAAEPRDSLPHSIAVHTSHHTALPTLDEASVSTISPSLTPTFRSLGIEPSLSSVPVLLTTLTDESTDAQSKETFSHSTPIKTASAAIPGPEDVSLSVISPIFSPSVRSAGISIPISLSLRFRGATNHPNRRCTRRTITRRRLFPWPGTINDS